MQSENTKKAHTSETSSGDRTVEAPDPLDKIQRLRWRNTIALVCINMPLAIYFGGSPLVTSMNAASGSVWLAPGVLQPALMNVIANGLISQLAGNFVGRLSPRGIFLAWVTSLANPLLIGLSTSPGFEWAQYLGAVIGSVGFSAALQFRAVVMQWWSLDDRAVQGAVVIGFSTGLHIVACTLFLAWSLSSLGLANTMYVMTGVMALHGVYPLWLAAKGELGGTALLGNPQAAGKATPSIQLRTSRKFWHLFFHMAAFPFVGFGMKALTTSIFEAAYGVSFLTSSYLTALSLALYVAVRGLFPLLTHRLPLLHTIVCLLAANSVLYATYPAVVANASQWVLLAAKTLTAGSFGAMQTVQFLMIIQIFGAASVGIVYAALGSAVCIGFAFGPVVGYYLGAFAELKGSNSHHSFDGFFYTCAVIAALDAVNVFFLSRAVAQQKLLEQKSEASSEQSREGP
eukprot:TRINITY_DN113502_c0_g1_i1.p1 TRINITY_DN113502_c0_g1~~TRINITY_DN113502_c0_g1_i1.p1  ORF type:complete len:457 (+),score=65.89 TRINITY_DN113502_c0_g1_i1:79-1449(+)